MPARGIRRSMTNGSDLAAPFALSEILLLPVRGSHAIPDVTNLMVADLGVVAWDAQPQRARRQPSDCGEHRIGVHQAVALRLHQRHAGVDQLVLGVEHVKCGALAKSASSRTPFSAASAALAWLRVDSIELLAASSSAHACATASRAWSRARLRSSCFCPSSPWPAGPRRIRSRNAEYCRLPATPYAPFMTAVK